MKKGREPRLPAEFSRVEVLEVEAQAEFHGSRRVALTRQRAETIGTGAGIGIVARTWVVEHRMIEEVYGDHLKIKIEALRDLEVLPKAKIHIPVGQAAKDTPAAILRVQAKNRLPDRIIGRVGISKEIG